MELYKIMEEYGFKKSSGCSGIEWYSKRTKYKGVDALITITANDEPRLPESLDERIIEAARGLLDHTLLSCHDCSNFL